jgi:hypothetical protein
MLLQQLFGKLDRPGQQNKDSTDRRPREPGGPGRGGGVRLSLQKQRALIYGRMFIKILLKMLRNFILKENGLSFLNQR